MISIESSELLGEQECANILRDMRWEEGIYCVHCFSQEIVKNGVRNDHVQQYYCKSCGKAFNDRTKTIFANTQMQLNECFYVIWRKDKKDSVNSIRKDLDRSWKTVSNFLRSLKCSFKSLELKQKVEKHQERDLEVDYSKFGCG